MQVSVVIPVYNVAPYLRKCLDSVSKRTLEDLEVICVDDGSTDGSSKILEEYAKQDRRFYIVHQKNRGPGKARNTGFSLATGKYLIFLDSDDWFAKELLEKMTQEANSTEADIVICRAESFDTNTNLPQKSAWMLKEELFPSPLFSPEEIALHLFQFTYGWPWDKLYRTKFVKKHCLKFPALSNSEDLVFVFQSLAMAEKIAVINEVLIHHRMSRSSSVSNSRHLKPDMSYSAVKLLQNRLKDRGLYHTFERSYLNWAMDFLIWNAANMRNRDA